MCKRASFSDLNGQVDYILSQLNTQHFVAAILNTVASNQELNPMHVYSEVSSIIVNGSYSQIRVKRIAA